VPRLSVAIEWVTWSISLLQLHVYEAWIQDYSSAVRFTSSDWNCYTSTPVYSLLYHYLIQRRWTNSVIVQTWHDMTSVLICVHIKATVHNSSNMVVVEASVHSPTTPLQLTPTSVMSTHAVVAQTPCVPPSSSSSRLSQRSLGETGNFCCLITYLCLYLSSFVHTKRCDREHCVWSYQVTVWPRPRSSPFSEMQLHCYPSCTWITPQA